MENLLKHLKEKELKDIDIVYTCGEIHIKTDWPSGLRRQT